MSQPTSISFRALCAELHTAVQLYTGQNPAAAETPANELVARLMAALAATAAALAQPEPEIGPGWKPCRKLPITVHVRDQRPGETFSTTREGITPLKDDDLIMRGVQGEEYPIGRELFQQTYTLLAQPEPEGLGDAQIMELMPQQLQKDLATVSRLAAHGAGPDVGPGLFRVSLNTGIIEHCRAVLTRYAHPTPMPVPVAERFEFSVFNSEYEEQAGGTAPTYAEALSYGQHYLSQYSQDGPHSLEIRRVEVFPHHALPLPTPTL
jgi:hypothetical protein